MTYNSRREKISRIRRARGIPSYVPAATVAQHIRTLTAAGWSRPDVAAAAHLSAGTVDNILAAAQPTVHQRTAAAILNLNPDHHPTWAPAIGTARRIQALAAAGWSVNSTARAADISKTLARDIASGRTRRVRHQVAAAVDDVFQQRQNIEGPSEWTRTVAASHEWVLASAWDDIDDPNARPREFEAVHAR